MIDHKIKALCISLLLFICILPIFSLGSIERQKVLITLENEGFTENYTYTERGDMFPSLFISKYEFVQNETDGFSIINSKTWEEERRITNPEWYNKHFEFYSVHDGKLFFSIESSSLFMLYTYSLSEDSCTKVFEKVTNNNSGRVIHNCVRYSVFDAVQGKLFLCEFGSSDTIQVYNVFQQEMIEEIHIGVGFVPECTFGNPMKILYSDSFEREKREYFLFDTQNYSVQKGADINFNLHLYHFKYDDGLSFYAINRTRFDTSELYRFNFQTGQSELYKLKDFKNLIIDLYTIPEGGYCLFIEASKGSYILSYFD